MLKRLEHILVKHNGPLGLTQRADFLDRLTSFFNLLE